MSSDSASLDDLAQSLGREFDARMDARRRAAIAEHEAQLAAVPPVTELTQSPQVRGMLAVGVVVLSGLALWCLKDAWPVSVPLWLLAALAIRSLWLQRDPGQQPLLRLTHERLWFACLDRELALVDLVEGRVRQGRDLHIVLTLKPDTVLPRPRNRLGPWMPRAKVKGGVQPQVTLICYGLTLQGQSLDAQALMDLLRAYDACAQAKLRLDALYAQG
ncbi:hypothetical protein [uncultured Pseudomonas sp.]|uniref:hypothetical protein n=1 Tax=uncultured Pseudomonas sp. TaxID=114707 RepID=UPI0025FE558B|nr:hypothetical protein [uncultured Pseudomonas sp.]